MFNRERTRHEVSDPGRTQEGLCVEMASSLDKKREDCQFQFVIYPGWRFEYHIFEIET